jgi:hypothetical protein
LTVREPEWEDRAPSCGRKEWSHGTTLAGRSPPESGAAVNELLPIAGGILLGALLTRLPPRARIPVGIVGVVLIGVAATVVSGEFRVSWGFLAIDVPGAAIATVCGYLLTRALAARRVARSG